MAKSDIKLSAVAEEFRELDLIFKSDCDLDVVERGYGRKLIDAIGSQNEVLECEALKSLGDLYLHKAKMKRHKAEYFTGACALYNDVLRFYKIDDEREIVQHRVKYAEKCTKLVYDEEVLKLRTDNLANITLAVSVVLHEVKEKAKNKGHGTMPLIESYTKSLVTAIIERNKCLEVESLKSLGDLYLEKGRVGRDEAAFTKSAGLYRAALDRCEDSDGRETLKHRIKYAEEVKEKLAKAMKRLETGRSQEQKVGIDNLLTSPVPYNEHLQEGCRALQTGDLDTAELSFAAALKVVHVQGEHRKEVEPLCKLSDVYLARGTQSKDGGDFTKAAALCNAALVRAGRENREDIEQTTQTITQSFVKHVLNIQHTVPADNVEKHKSTLKEHRAYVEQEINRIEDQIDPYCLDDDDPKTKEVEENRAEAIKGIFDTIVHQRRMFIASLVDECVDVMGPPPCKYAMIGLGSQATGLVTPYSDLEFAILIEKETENNVKYFHNLTHFLHLKVINLGETILPAMAIKSLNNFASDNTLDSWFYDSVTPRGLAFDGAMPHACKTPLGRGKTCHLIRTPRAMVQILEDDVTLHLKKGYHMATVLGSVSLITGEQHLVDEYTVAWDHQLKKSGRNFASLVAKTMLMENSQMFLRQDLTDRILDVKKDMYRFSSLAVSCLAHIFDIQPTTIWDTIQKMRKTEDINDENEHHLMVLVSISAELRLRTYMNNRGQVENMSALSSMSANSDIEETSKKIFYISNTRQLMRYYYTATPLKYFFSRLANGQSLTEPLVLFDKSFKLQAEVYKSLCDNEKWKAFTERALQEERCKYGKDATHHDIANLLNNVGLACKSLGDTRKAISYYQQSLQMVRKIHGASFANTDTAASLNNLGLAWGDLGEHRKAVSCHEQSLQMRRVICNEDTGHFDIASSLHNLGVAWSELGEYRKALSYHDQSLQMMRNIYGENSRHPDIAISIIGLGNSWDSLGDQRKAVSYYEQALQMMRHSYGENTAHPNIAGCLNSLGIALNKLGDHRKAVDCLKQALLISRRIHGESTAHADIAMSLDHLGTVWKSIGEYRRSVRYYEQSLQMRQSIHGRTGHPNIASSLNNLGTAWGALGDHRKALGYYEQSLQMRRSIYGERTAHSDIAASLTTLGNAWRGLGNHRKAIIYYEQSLQMSRSLYGEGTAHPDIAASLSNLGTIWNGLGDHRKAISYYERALQMTQSIRGESTVHPDIAIILNNLGTAWNHLGYYSEGVSYLEKALQIRRSIHGENTAHPDIADSLNNLGAAWSNLGNDRKAVGYSEQSLQMRRSIYGENTAHPDVARSFGNLGNAWSHLGDHRKAVRYFEQSLQMMWRIHGENTAHPDIATSLNNLGIEWGQLGDYRKAISYFEKALRIRWAIYGEGTAHPFIANSLNNLGAAWSQLGEHRKAVIYYEQSLEMTRSIYGDKTAHSNVAKSLNNLGNAWVNVGDFRKAIGYFEQSLQTMRKIHGETTAHPDIATSLNNLGVTWSKLGNRFKASSYLAEAALMKQKIECFKS
ncbi:uncharacterized protein LOC144864155 [Branchiostoma floridae x Branchiostoma japonicum]